MSETVAYDNRNELEMMELFRTCRGYFEDQIDEHVEEMHQTGELIKI